MRTLSSRGDSLKETQRGEEPGAQRCQPLPGFGCLDSLVTAREQGWWLGSLLVPTGPTTGRDYPRKSCWVCFLPPA